MEQKTAYTLNKQNLGLYLFTSTDSRRPVLGSILVDHDRFNPHPPRRTGATVGSLLLFPSAL